MLTLCSKWSKDRQTYGQPDRPEDTSIDGSLHAMVTVQLVKGLHACLQALPGQRGLFSRNKQTVKTQQNSSIIIE